MICKICNQEMTDAQTTSCLEAAIDFPDGMALLPIPWDGPGRCPDCNVDINGFHHTGCDIERCPLCHGQLIGCGCLNYEE